jgi:DNA-binding NarL/FixJ family response regulator
VPNRYAQDVAAAVCRWELPRLSTGSSTRPRAQVRRAARRGFTELLSLRERDVAALIGQGLKNREIAAALVLSERTVHGHARNLLGKLGLMSRAQIAVWVAQGGLGVAAGAPEDGPAELPVHAGRNAGVAANRQLESSG